MINFLTLLLAFLLFTAPSYAAAQNTIRVRVEESKEKLTLTIKSSYKVEDLNSGIVLYKGKSLRRRDAVPTNSGLKLGAKDFKVYGIRIIPSRDGAIYLGDKRLRGTLDLIRTEGLKLLAVNRLDLEKYLYGVLYKEVPHYWPLEALRAQAIAARTFALHRKEISRDREYDVTNDIYSQVYGGLSNEKWRTTRAVDLTKGKILTYKGEIFPAYYHSICGGHTGDAGPVFEIDLPPLKGKACPYCRGARGMDWKASYSYKQMEEKLNEYGIKAKGISFIVEGKRDRSGRLETLKIKDEEGVKDIKGYKFRLALGPGMIRSTNFSITITRRGVMFKGIGWGHGIGLCQWGAFGMSKKRAGYKQILEHYYPGAKIETVRF